MHSMKVDKDQWAGALSLLELRKLLRRLKSLGMIGSAPATKSSIGDVKWNAGAFPICRLGRSR